MSTSCVIISPTRTSKTIRIKGSEPFIEGSNDDIVTVPEIKTDKKVPPKKRATSFSLDSNTISEDKKEKHAKKSPPPLITPNLSGAKFVLPPVGKLRDSIHKNTETVTKIQEPDEEENFADQNTSSVERSFSININKTKDQQRNGVPRTNRVNDFKGYGIDSSVADVGNFASRDFINNETFSRKTYHEKPRILNSPPDLDVLDEMYKLDQVSIEIYSNPSIVSKNGCIEPLNIREITTFEFVENSFKSSLAVTDVRRRSFILDSCSKYNEKSVEFFEDNVDIFHSVEKSVIKNKFKETYNSDTKKYTISAIAGITHNNKNLDMSWISDDNAKNLPYELKAQTIDEEVSESDYMTLNNLDISNYYNDNNITVGNTYPKIYEDKRSTGYTYDRSKVQGLDSIAFSGIME
jgi:hypothetical protein